MGKRIFVISKFIKKEGAFNRFHFRGFYKGFKIEEILIEQGTFSRDEEYILAIDEISIEKNKLIGKLAKSRLLFI